jgi:hypothetical protein
MFVQLDQVLGYQDVNDIKRFWANSAAPDSPGTGEIWLDTSTTPPALKRYNGSTWEALLEGFTFVNGKIGLGTTNPGYEFHLYRVDDYARIAATKDQGATVIMSGSQGFGGIGTMSDHDLRLFTNENTGVILTKDLNFGIGTLTPSTKLEVLGDTNISGKLTAGNIQAGTFDIPSLNVWHLVTFAAFFQTVPIITVGVESPMVGVIIRNKSTSSFEVRTSDYLGKLNYIAMEV